MAYDVALSGYTITPDMPHIMVNVRLRDGSIKTLSIKAPDHTAARVEAHYVFGATKVRCCIASVPDCGSKLVPTPEAA